MAPVKVDEPPGFSDPSRTRGARPVQCLSNRAPRSRESATRPRQPPLRMNTIAQRLPCIPVTIGSTLFREPYHATCQPADRHESSSRTLPCITTYVIIGDAQQPADG